MKFSERLRKRAAETKLAAQQMVEAADFSTNAKKQMLATVGHVRAGVLSDLAEVVDELQGKPPPPKARTAGHTKRNHELRTVAALGDWNEFDRIVDRYFRELQEGAAGPDGE